MILDDNWKQREYTRIKVIEWLEWNKKFKFLKKKWKEIKINDWKYNENMIMNQIQLIHKWV